MICPQAFHWPPSPWQHFLSGVAGVVLLLQPADSAPGVTSPAGSSTGATWRTLPLITDGKISSDWVHIGWGRFAVAADGLRTECDERGMGLLVYQRERLGDCRLRVVYRAEKPKSNSGVYVRLDDGILTWTNRPSVAVRRDAKGKLPKDMVQKLMAASEAEEGVWYAVHHGYEVQIMDDNDDAHRTGAIYGLAKAAPLPPAADGAWRTMLITLRENVVTVAVDGKQLSRFDAASPDLPPRQRWTEPKRDAPRPVAGYIALQNHDPGDVVFFKAVSVAPLD